MGVNENYHLKLREFRKEKKWTQKETAEKIGISRSYYSDIENGRTLPSGKTLFKINNVLPIFLTINDVNTIQYSGCKEVN